MNFVFYQDMISFAEIFMTVVGTIMALAGVPQIIRILQRRSAADISLTMYIIFVAGQICWVWYGVLMSSTSLVVANSVGLCVNSTIVVLTLRFRSQ
jgi:MtN3 and saliva related transmembrane protein